MSQPLDLLYASAEDATRTIARRILAQAKAAAKRLLDASDETALHDFRVAIRRLRSTLRAWRGPLKGRIGRKHERMLSALQRATGGGRDAEVALDYLGVHPLKEGAAADDGHRWLVHRLSEQFQASMQDVREPVREAFRRTRRKLRRRLRGKRQRTAPVSFAQALAAAVGRHGEDLRVRLERVATRADEDEAHEARIRGKRLRYLVEPVAKGLPEAAVLVKRCRALQDVLGDLNDASVLAAAIRDWQSEAGPTAREGLDARLAQIDRHGATLFAAFARDWLGDARAALAADVAALVRRLEAAAPNVEIERTFLLRTAPTLPSGAETFEIEQGYLPCERGEERVRRKRGADGVRLIRSTKVGKGLQRLEREEAIDAVTFDALWLQTEGRRVRKRRHVVQENGHTWEVDEFVDRDLWLAEVELDRVDADLELPTWLSTVLEREVTEDTAFSNQRLAR